MDEHEDQVYARKEGRVGQQSTSNEECFTATVLFTAARISKFAIPGQIVEHEIITAKSQ